MSFLEGAYSQVVAAAQKRGLPSLQAESVPTGDRELSWAPQQVGGSPLAGVQLANAVGQPNAFVSHRGNLRIVGQLSRLSRDYSRHTGDNALHPTPPVGPPSVVRGILSVTNADDGTANLMGEQGYSVHVEQGISRFDGPIWGGRWIKIDSTGNVTDTLAGELGAGVDDRYYFADGRVVGDSKGRDLEDIPARIFYVSESGLPSIGEVVFEGMKDGMGLAWGGGPGKPRVGMGKVTTEWSWVTGQINVAARISFNPATAPYGGTADTTRTYSAIAMAGPDVTPTGYPPTVFAYSQGPSGNRIAISGNVYDEQIGSVKEWLGGLGSIPRGWVLITSETEGAGRYIIGYAAGGDYDTPGTLLGRHPIQPIAHPSTSVSIATATPTVDPHAADTTDLMTTHIEVNRHPTSYVHTSTTHIGVTSHPEWDVKTSHANLTSHRYSHAHRVTDVWVAIDNVMGQTPLEDNTPMDPWTSLGGSTPHAHTARVSVGLYWQADATPGGPKDWTRAHTSLLEHTSLGHLHTSRALEHEVVDRGHNHTTPTWYHSITDPGHLHGTKTLIHNVQGDPHAHTTPVLVHAEEDFRSPGAVLVMIKRVGPGEGG